MLTPEDIAAALDRAGVHDLAPSALAYLSGRLVKQGASGGATPTNLGGLRDVTFGSAARGGGLASFPDIDTAARALVSVSCRAAPRRWGDTTDAELAGLAMYPQPTPVVGDVVADLFRMAVRTASSSADAFIFAPNKADQEAFQRLMADWEGYDRLGVGERILAGEKGPDGLRRVNVREDVVDWRKFRDEWLAGQIDGAEIAARLNPQVSVSNKIRRYLKETNAIDPVLQRDEARGVDVEESTGALQLAADVDKSARSNAFVNWVTSPGNKTNLPIIGAVPTKVLWVGGLGLGLALFVMARRGPTTRVVIEQPKPEGA